MSIQDIIQQAEKLPTTDKWRLVRHLLDDLEEQPPAPSSEWQARLHATRGSLADEAPPEEWASFVGRMYGALADDPID